MKKLLALITAVIMILTLSLSAFADGNETASNGKLDEMAKEIQSFEEAHPELKDAFHQMIKDVMDIVTQEYREAFISIQSRFGDMLEENRPQTNVSEEGEEGMREKLEIQASIINASFIAHVKASEDRMIAALRDTEFTEGEVDVIATLRRISDELQGSDDARMSKLKAGIDKVLETAEKDYNNDLSAWYSEVSARPELPDGVTGKPEDESHPPMPAKGEKPDAGESEAEARNVPFNDHFKVIYEELKGASERIDERIQALANELPDKYAMEKDTASEALGMLHAIFTLVNGQMMERMGNMDAFLFGHLMTSES